MRILLDEKAPSGLRRLLAGHDVRTVPEMGWNGYTNGQLLSEAERAGFEALITGDRSLPYQQNLAGRNIAVIIFSTMPGHHSHPAADGAARGRECLTGHFHLCHFSSSLTIPAPACTHLLLVQIIHLVPGSERGSRRVAPVAARSGDSLLSEPTAGTQPCRREPLFMPRSRLSWGCPATPESGGNSITPYTIEEAFTLS
jgi:hypothetical protein